MLAVGPDDQDVVPAAVDPFAKPLQAVGVERRRDLGRDGRPAEVGQGHIGEAGAPGARGRHGLHSVDFRTPVDRSRSDGHPAMRARVHALALRHDDRSALP